MLKLTDDELSALIEACNVADRHDPRQPWGRAGGSAWRKLINEERFRADKTHSKGVRNYE